MSETIYILSLCIPLFTIAAIFGMKYFASVQQARAHQANDEAYRDLAAKAAAAQAETSARLASIEAALAQIGARQAAVEKMLKEVE